MLYLNNFKMFKESNFEEIHFNRFDDLMESLNIWHDALLTSIKAEEVDIFEEFNLDKEVYDNVNIEFFYNDIEFINSLTSMGLKKSKVVSSDDFETFLNKPCKFMFVHEIESNQLENPVYLLIQLWNETLSKWESVDLYKTNGNVNGFYDKLTSRTIVIEDGGDEYIYETNNGNEWFLKNSNKSNDVYRKVFRKNELKEILNRKDLKINVL